MKKVLLTTVAALMTTTAAFATEPAERLHTPSAELQSVLDGLTSDTLGELLDLIVSHQNLDCDLPQYSTNAAMGTCVDIKNNVEDFSANDAYFLLGGIVTNLNAHSTAHTTHADAHDAALADAEAAEAARLAPVVAAWDAYQYAVDHNSTVDVLNYYYNLYVTAANNANEEVMPTNHDHVIAWHNAFAIATANNDWIAEYNPSQAIIGALNEAFAAASTGGVYSTESVDTFRTVSEELKADWTTQVDAFNDAVEAYNTAVDSYPELPELVDPVSDLDRNGILTVLDSIDELEELFDEDAGPNGQSEEYDAIRAFVKAQYGVGLQDGLPSGLGFWAERDRLNEIIDERAAAAREVVNTYNNSVIEAWETVVDTAEVIGASLDGLLRHDESLEIVEASDDDTVGIPHGLTSPASGSDCSVCQAHTPTN